MPPRTAIATRPHVIDVPPTPESTALARQQGAVVVRPAPPEAMRDAIASYVELQKTLDAALPECIMRIQGRSFRKKNYWRAVATAFNLTVECAEEKWEDFDGDWCCDVTYRASAPNGRMAYGDGSCSFREKSGKQATRHNVRSHAHTRAYNRAVSNLVGFGEVSAEEVNRDGRDEAGGEPPEYDRQPDAPKAMTLATFRQWIGSALSAQGGWSKEQVAALLREHGAEKADGVAEDDRAMIVARLREPPPAKTDDKGHHPSWNADRAHFCATVGELGFSYEDVKAWSVANEDPKPSAMPQGQRDALLAHIRSENGAEDLRAFIASTGAK